MVKKSDEDVIKVIIVLIIVGLIFMCKDDLVEGLDARCTKGSCKSNGPTPGPCFDPDAGVCTAVKPTNDTPPYNCPENMIDCSGEDSGDVKPNVKPNVKPVTSIQYGMNLDSTTLNNAPHLDLINGGNWPATKSGIGSDGNKRISAIRLFDYYDNGGREWAKSLINNSLINKDFKVLIGIWIPKNPRLKDVDVQINNIIKDYNSNPSGYTDKVIGISVGNETNDENGHQYVKAGDLKNYIERVKKKLNDNNWSPKITTTLAANLNVAGKINGKEDDWSTNNFKVGDYLDTIKDVIDVVSVNFYPYYNGDDVPNVDLLLSTKPHKSMLHNQISQVQYAIINDDVLKGKKLWVTETGWAHKGNSVASQDNMETYYTNILNLPENKDIVPNDSNEDSNGNFDPSFDLPEWIFYFTFRDTDVNFGLIK